MTATPAPATPAGAAAALDPVSVVRSRAYLSALVLAALLGIPISAVAYGFLALVGVAAGLPVRRPARPACSTARRPAWWPVPWLMLCGLLVALTIRYLPGPGGHSPALGFKVGGGPAGRPPPARHRPRRRSRR